MRMTKKQATTLAARLVGKTAAEMVPILQGPKMKPGGGRNKGNGGELEVAKLIRENCPGLSADRNARNGKEDTDVLVWRCSCSHDQCVCSSPRHAIEVKREKALNHGTAMMERFREKAIQDGAIGILWRRNREPWRLDCQWYGSWVTFSGPDVWKQIESIVTE